MSWGLEDFHSLDFCSPGDFCSQEDFYPQILVTKVSVLQQFCQKLLWLKSLLKTTLWGQMFWHLKWLWSETYCIVLYHYSAFSKIFLDILFAGRSYTLDSGINVPPGITVAPPLKNFYITILILFYINLGIAVIFKFFLSSKIFKN